MPACDRDSARAARAILSAFAAANFPALEDALERSAELLPPLCPYPDLEAERRELLGALSRNLLEGIRRVQRGLATRIEGLETSLALLAHLARTPPVAISARLR